MNPVVQEQQSGREELVLNMGPHHPSTHGVLRFVLHTDGEVIRKAIPDVGYLHRGLEKMAELKNYNQYMPFTDRINYLEAMFTNMTFARAVEQVLQVEIPARADYIRVIACELNRIASHMVTLGSVAMDMGAITPFVYLLRERETINDLFEALCGQRLTFNYIRIGGVAYDAEDAWLKELEKFLTHFEPIIEELDSLISFNEILIQRLVHIAAIPGEQAIAYGLVGPNLRASGVSWDLRRDQPYSVYGDLKFDVPVGKGTRGKLGDCYDRYAVRVEELRQSCKILRQCLSKLPDGEIKGKVPRTVKLPKCETYACVEGARGELGVYIISDGNANPYRVKWRSGSYAAMGIIEDKSHGIMIADLVAVIATLDVIAPEIDR